MSVATAERGKLLFGTSPQPLSFAKSLVARSYLVATPEGNALIYSSQISPADMEEITDRGAPVARFLNHWHEAMFEPGVDLIEGIPVTVGRDDRPETEVRMPVADTIDDRGFVLPGLEAIPTPGHTPGATAYLWESDGVRRLFAGDSVYMGARGWQVAVLGDSDPVAYAESLELMATLEFDVLVPWAGPSDLHPVDRVTRDEGRRRMLKLAERVRGGATG